MSCRSRANAWDLRPGLRTDLDRTAKTMSFDFSRLYECLTRFPSLGGSAPSRMLIEHVLRAFTITKRPQMVTVPPARLQRDSCRAAARLDGLFADLEHQNQGDRGQTRQNQ